MLRCQEPAEVPLIRWMQGQDVQLIHPPSYCRALPCLSRAHDPIFQRRRLSLEDIRDQVPSACKWQTWNQDPSFLSLRTETFLPHSATFLVNSCASLAPSTCNTSNTHLLSAYFMPGLSYRWDKGPGGPTETELTGRGGGCWGVRRGRRGGNP